MKLYKVIKHKYDWDEYDSCIVRAESEDRAIELCRKMEFGYCSYYFEKDNVDVYEIRIEGTEEVILGSFNAG